ncbi:hypothetical protein BpHYR1_046934 [Brachionus plicatilis]|uniref:Uncharacterized protein n=1 Tax=Brachionus plicatilis TaxID=10195 RepID=A0A3M7RG84_BRAPC|nr:hypothetical protein BpHYR1_046934 [Brachionus plicatilis]
MSFNRLDLFATCQALTADWQGLFVLRHVLSWLLLLLKGILLLAHLTDFWPLKYKLLIGSELGEVVALIIWADDEADELDDVVVVTAVSELIELMPESVSPNWSLVLISKFLLFMSMDGDDFNLAVA